MRWVRWLHVESRLDPGPAGLVDHLSLLLKGTKSKPHFLFFSSCLHKEFNFHRLDFFERMWQDLLLYIP